MKKLVVSVGIIALGSSVLHALETGALNAQQSKKAWSVSASLRGFYDDNFNSQPNGSKQSSTGVEIRPTVDFGVAGDQSSFNVGYDFTARYFEKAVNGSSDHSDFTHQFNADATHAVSERVKLNASESFVVGQEPDLQRGTIDNPQRISGDNVRNYASVGANIQATSLVGFGVSYNNTLVDYEDDFSIISPNTNPTNIISQSALLDRIEHSVNLDSRWTISPQTVGILGVSFSRTEFTRENEFIDSRYVGTNTVPFATNLVQTTSSSRDSRSFVLKGGFEHEFSSQLSGLFLIGGQRTEYPNKANSEAKWTPWVQTSLDYQYQERTKLSVGFSHQRGATDVVAAQANATTVDFVLDSKVSSFYATLSHEITAHLTGSASARYQSSTYNGGSVNGQKENFLLLGLGLAYEFNPNFEGNIGYNFDDLSSDAAGRNYTRNKFYVGVTAKY